MDCYDNDCQIQLKKIRLVRNGTANKVYNIKLKQNIYYQQLVKQIVSAMHLQTKSIRIFRKGGVEVDPEEVDYVKNNEILYISEGEEFDQNSHLAEYKILQEIGAGGFGTVYEGRHRLTKQKVAIKITAAKTQSVKEVESILKEISALKYLNHKNIITILNAFFIQEEFKVAIILEYMEGGELKEYLRQQGKLPEQECQFFFRQLYQAMAYCHNRQIIHRDLKLENIMLTDRISKQIRVVDFGISGSSNQINTEYTTAGSLRYLAPEVILYKAAAHSGIDIWAMGVILYWMLHGHAPFDGQNRQEILQKIVKGDYIIDPLIQQQTSSDCLDLLRRMLKVDKKQRIKISEIGEHPWIKEELNQLFIKQEVIEQQENIVQHIQVPTVVQDKKKSSRNKNSFAQPTQSFLNRQVKQSQLRQSLVNLS